MFTGLIEDLGTVRQKRRSGEDVTLTVETKIPAAELTLGESIAVNGVCLTVRSFDNSSFTVDASVETMTRTALSEVRVGDRVHLERALRVGDRLGGHFVQGHVDSVGEVDEVTSDGSSWQVWILLEEGILDEVVEKGSITVDGVSLTINELDGRRCRLTIIPFTSDETRLTEYRRGRRVNIETDVIAKHVKRLLTMGGGTHRKGTADLLAQFGYLKQQS